MGSTHGSGARGELVSARTRKNAHTPWPARVRAGPACRKDAVHILAIVWSARSIIFLAEYLG
eukprot:352167-Pleurochrysis_carterae.AAC.1